MILHINTIKNDNRQIGLELVVGGKVIAKKTVNAHMQQAEKLLPAISKILERKDLDIKNIKKIKVVNSGGSPALGRGASFTALRIGVVTANALGYALGVPVEGTRESGKTQKSKEKAEFDIIKPIYDKEPNITFPTVD